MLCQLTANATRLPVRAGPVEATALGNLMVQAYSRGHVGSLEEMRAVVRASPVEVRDYLPGGGTEEWESAYGRLRKVMEANVQLAREGAKVE